eukprot:gene5107-5471_t
MEQFEDDVDIHGSSNLLQEIELNHNPTLRSRAPSIHKNKNLSVFTRWGLLHY